MFFELIGRAVIDGRTLWVLAGLLVLVFAAGRSAALRRGAARVPVILFALHVATLGLAAAAQSQGYAAQQYWIASFAFELFAVIAIGSLLVFRAFLPRMGWTLPRILVDIITGVAVLVALIAIGKRAGLSLAGLITTSAILTAVIGFALQDTLGNVMGGIALQLDRSIQVGDWITLGPGQPPGRVIEIRWRYTALETNAWSTIIVPNSVLMKGQVTVLGRRTGEPMPKVRRDVEFFVDVQTPPGDVIDAVQAVLQANPVPRMAADPPVQVILFAAADGRGCYRLRYWLEDMGADELTDATVRARVWYALRRAGMAFSLPAQQLLVTPQDEAHHQRRDDRELARRLDAIARVDLLAVLGDDERRRLAERLRYAPFARGEAMTREGEVDDGLYMIVEGEAGVRIGSDDACREVARLRAGQFFGEMSLMTGAKRSATVVAVTDVVTYRLDKAAFEELVRSRPEIADAVADLLAERRMHLEAARGELDDAAQARRRATTKNDILGRIRGFFNLGEWR